MDEKSVRLANARYEASLDNEASEEYILRLFITGASLRSCRAVNHLKQFCNDNLQGHYQLEVVDVYQHPEIAREEQILAAPTLIKQWPLPRRVMVGDLSNSEMVRKVMGIARNN